MKFLQSLSGQVQQVLKGKLESADTVRLKGNVWKVFSRFGGTRKGKLAL